MGGEVKLNVGGRLGAVIRQQVMDAVGWRKSAASACHAAGFCSVAAAGSALARWDVELRVERRQFPALVRKSNEGG